MDAHIIAFNGGADVTVACDLTWNVTAVVDPKVDNCEQDYNVVYTITDQCGRTASCTQVFTIDNADPTIACPAPATVTCYEDIQAMVDAHIIAFNGGTDVTVACDLTWNVTAVVDPKARARLQCGVYDYGSVWPHGELTQVFTIDNGSDDCLSGSGDGDLLRRHSSDGGCAHHRL